MSEKLVELVRSGLEAVAKEFAALQLIEGVSFPARFENLRVIEVALRNSLQHLVGPEINREAFRAVLQARYPNLRDFSLEERSPRNGKRRWEAYGEDSEGRDIIEMVSETDAGYEIESFRHTDE